MEAFSNFSEWCRYWSSSYNMGWRELRNRGMDTDVYVDQYICRIEFKTNSDGKSACHDVCSYEQDHGYGLPSSYIDNSERIWDIWLDCPDLPLVIRMANNHGGVIKWWNDKIIHRPPAHIPFYIPEKPVKKTPQSSGCYIATAVYGSYDCPEVWTLRRYRDNVLDKSWYGRLFIKCYYAISPTLVKWFGKSNWFRNLFSKPLSKWVNKLNENGLENTPYNDKY